MPKPDRAKVGRLVAEANALCGSLAHRASPLRTREREAVARRVQRISNALGPAAAYLPAGRTLNEAHAKRRALYAELHRAGRGGNFPEAFELIERFYRLRVQVYGALKALGLTPCLGPPPRPPISG
jgi:hypothetical protein